MKQPQSNIRRYTDIMAPLAAMLTFLKMEVISQLVRVWYTVYYQLHDAWDLGPVNIKVGDPR